MEGAYCTELPKVFLVFQVLIGTTLPAPPSNDWSENVSLCVSTTCSFHTAVNIHKVSPGDILSILIVAFDGEYIKYMQRMPITVYTRRALKGWIIFRKRLLSTKSTRELWLSGCVQNTEKNNNIHTTLYSTDSLGTQLVLMGWKYYCSWSWSRSVSRLPFIFSLADSNHFPLSGMFKDHTSWLLLCTHCQL